MTVLRLRRYRPVALMLFGLHLNACSTWQPVPVNLRQLIEEEQPDRIRIFQPDGTRIEVRNPRVETDSLTAEVPVRLSPLEFGTETVKIPLTDVHAFEIRRFDMARTLGLIVAVPLATLGGLLLLVGITCGDGCR